MKELPVRNSRSFFIFCFTTEGQTTLYRINQVPLSESMLIIDFMMRFESMCAYKNYADYAPFWP